jgi:hypothetical protein
LKPRDISLAISRSAKSSLIGLPVHGSVPMISHENSMKRSHAATCGPRPARTRSSASARVVIGESSDTHRA